MNNKSAIIFGASGLVGSSLLEQLLASDSYQTVVAVTRRSLSLSDVLANNLENILEPSQRLTDKYKNKVIDFEQTLFNQVQQEPLATLFSPQSDLYLCLGTTMKTAKSKAAFRRVDFDYTTQIASLAKSHCVANAALVSAIGASAEKSYDNRRHKDSAFFYTQVKTQTEQFLIDLGFEHLAIARPSLLLGERDEVRLGESLGQKLLPVFATALIGPLQQYRPIKGSLVAKSMLNALSSADPRNNAKNSNNDTSTAKVSILSYADFINS